MWVPPTPPGHDPSLKGHGFSRATILATTRATIQAFTTEYAAPAMHCIKPHMLCVHKSCFLILLAASTLHATAQLPTSIPNPKQQCSSLQGTMIAPAAIGLPTTGATVTAAKLQHGDLGEYCRVLAFIRSVDPAAQGIHLEVNLPTNWNRKAVQFGGGAFDGWLGATNGLKHLPVSIAADPGPLQRGYATFGGDSGHHKHYVLLPDVVNAVNASFALNAEERRNFAQDGLKKTHDAAVAIIDRFYGKPPERMFFLGGSTGGREAFFVMQLWPNDYDGVLGAYAGWDQTELDLQFIRVSQAMYAKGGFLSKGKTRLLASAVMKSCDALDGVADGIISNVAACHFDPATLLCPAGTDSKNCLTASQLHTVQTFATEQKTDRPLWHGVDTMPGFNVLSGADLTGSMGLFQHPEHPPKILLNSFYYVVGDQVLRFFLTGDTHFDALTFNTTTGGAYGDKLLVQSTASDASDPDLTPFAQHGGKFLMLHGTSDTTIPTNSSVLYYHMMQKTMTQDQIDQFMRFYLIPGFGHGRGDFNAGFDALGVLDRWVSTGTAPAHLIVVDNNKKSGGRTRPLCDYPAWPRYNGGGDIRAAASFTCSSN